MWQACHEHSQAEVHGTGESVMIGFKYHQIEQMGSEKRHPTSGNLILMTLQRLRGARNPPVAPCTKHSPGVV